ncbi:MAG: hypothetical protein PHQ50_07590 [Eubacteriales bacterium]|nr:hypothetical protein [Eubacteriales bacterium]
MGNQHNVVIRAYFAEGLNIIVKTPKIIEINVSRGFRFGGDTQI